MLIKNAILIALVDMIWLTFISHTYKEAIKGIQGSLLFRPIYAIPVYLALGYILDFAPEPKTAFFLGMAVYAVYDFTLLTLFHKYPLFLALADTLWGGCLLFLTKKMLALN